MAAKSWLLLFLIECFVAVSMVCSSPLIFHGNPAGVDDVAMRAGRAQVIDTLFSEPMVAVVVANMREEGLKKQTIHRDALLLQVKQRELEVKKDAVIESENFVNFKKRLFSRTQ